MDETPAYFNLVPGKTVDRVGVKCCIIRSIGAEKWHIMIALTVTANSTMLSPMVIFKGKHNLKLKAPEGVLVCVQPKPWIDESLMEQYLQCIWQPYVKKTAEELGLPDHDSLLTLYSFKRHTTDEIKEKMEEHGMTYCIIPGGCTSKLQPLDVSANNPFKQMLKGSWANYIHTEVNEIEEQTAKVKTASKQQVLDWMVSAWEKMKDKKDLITKSFQVTGITFTDPKVVHNDEVLKRTMEAAQKELSLEEESGDEDDPWKTHLLTLN